MGNTSTKKIKLNTEGEVLFKIHHYMKKARCRKMQKLETFISCLQRKSRQLRGKNERDFSLFTFLFLLNLEPSESTAYFKHTDNKLAKKCK